MGIENKGWHVAEEGEKPLKDMGEKEMDAVVKGLAPEGKKWQKLAAGESPLSEAGDKELEAAAESLEHGKRHVEGGKGMLAEASEEEIDKAVEALGGDEKNPFEELVAKTVKKDARPKAKPRLENGPQDQA